MKTFGSRLGTTGRVVCNLVTYSALRLSRIVTGDRRIDSPHHWYRFPFGLRNRVLWSPALQAWFCAEDESGIECMLNLPRYEPVGWVAPREGEVFLDVGAYVGWFSMLASRAVGKSGRVVAFEPQPENRRQLAKNLHLNHLANVEVSSFAVWSRTGQVGWRTGTQAVWHSAEDAALGGSVQAVAIDDIAAKLGLRRVDWIKMDIEGGEVAALTGAAEVLREFRPAVYIEVHETLSPVLDRLGSVGYSVRQQQFDEPPDKHGWILARSNR